MAAFITGFACAAAATGCEDVVAADDDVPPLVDDAVEELEPAVDGPLLTLNMALGATADTKVTNKKRTKPLIRVSVFEVVTRKFLG